MQITYERSGGFGGLTLTAELDTASLPPDEAHDVQKMIEKAGFFTLPASTPALTRGADAFQYVVTVKADGKQHTVRMSDMAIPDALWPLIEYLTKVAKEKRRGPALRGQG
jgi:hypothetical protein